MKYRRQTAKPFKIRYHEQLSDFKHNNHKSKFAQYLLEKQHSIDKMENIMDILHTTNKGQMMDIMEK